MGFVVKLWFGWMELIRVWFIVFCVVMMVEFSGCGEGVCLWERVVDIVLVCGEKVVDVWVRWIWDVGCR